MNMRGPSSQIPLPFHPKPKKSEFVVKKSEFVGSKRKIEEASFTEPTIINDDFGGFLN
jgi:hypothetical protein